MSNLKRDFKGIWIPREIWLNPELTLQEKVFLVEISSLDNEEGCFANNEYFAKFFGISKVRVSEIINSLVSKKLIESLVNQSEGNKRTLKTLANFPLRPSQTFLYDPRKLSFKHSNTINNTVNNTTDSKESVTLSTKDKMSKPLQAKEKDARARCIEFWLKEFHVGWTFGAVHGKAINSIIKKIKSKGEGLSDEFIVNSFKDMCKRLPDWFQNKDLPVIDSKFNEIIYQIYTGKKKDGFHSKNSADRFSDFNGRV